MPKRSSKEPVPEPDPNVSAFDTLQKIIMETEGTDKDPLAVALGRRGGLKGGKARAAALSPSKRKAIAKKAAAARWSKSAKKTS